MWNQPVKSWRLRPGVLSAGALLLVAAGEPPRPGEAPSAAHSYVLVLVDETDQLRGTAAAVEGAHLVEILKARGLPFQFVRGAEPPLSRCPATGSCDRVEIRHFASSASVAQFQLSVSPLRGPAPDRAHPEPKVRRCPRQSGDTVEDCVEEQVTPLEFWLKDMDVPLHRP